MTHSWLKNHSTLLYIQNYMRRVATGLDLSGVQSVRTISWAGPASLPAPLATTRPSPVPPGPAAEGVPAVGEASAGNAALPAREETFNITKHP